MVWFELITWKWDVLGASGWCTHTHTHTHTHTVTTIYSGIRCRYVLYFHRRPQICLQSQQAWLYDFRRSPCGYSNFQYRIPFSFPSTNKDVLDKMVLKQIMYKVWCRKKKRMLLSRHFRCDKKIGREVCKCMGADDGDRRRLNFFVISQLPPPTPTQARKSSRMIATLDVTTRYRHPLVKADGDVFPSKPHRM